MLAVPKGRTPADAKRRKEAREKLLANAQRDKNAKRRIAEAQAQEEHVRQTQNLVEEHNADKDGHQAMEKMVDSVREKLEKEAKIEAEKKKKLDARKELDKAAAVRLERLGRPKDAFTERCKFGEHSY